MLSMDWFKSRRARSSQEDAEIQPSAAAPS
jgi:hypothetical protein